MKKHIFVAGICLALSSPSHADDLSVGDLTLSDPWVRVTTSVARASGAFVKGGQLQRVMKDVVDAAPPHIAAGNLADEASDDLSDADLDLLAQFKGSL